MLFINNNITYQPLTKWNVSFCFFCVDDLLNGYMEIYLWCE